jgi:hypothetical protein
MAGITRKRVKKHCIKNTRTRRCVRSFDRDETSSSCKLFNRTGRCRSIKEESYVEYKGYMIKKSVKTFLNNKIQKVPLQKLIESAEKYEDYEDTVQFILENRNKTEVQIKDDVENEILDLAKNESRDRLGSEVILLKSLKKVLTSNKEFSFIL